MTTELLIRKNSPRHLDHGWMTVGGKTYCFLEPCDGCERQAFCDRSPVTLEMPGDTVNIRRALIAPRGEVIVAIDYKGIELRIAANLSKEPVWIEAISNDKDLHAEMAALSGKKPVDQVTKQERSLAKTQNFGNLYGGSAFTLARQSGLSLPEADTVWNGWWNALPTLKRWTETQHHSVMQYGYVQTYFGRRRQLQHMLDKLAAAKLAHDGKKERQQKGFIERTSVNTPIQGTAADVMKIAMVKVDRAIKEMQIPDRCAMLMQIHDELVFRMSEKHFEEIAPAIGSIMSYSVPGWKVPLAVDIEYGSTSPSNWGELSTMKQKKSEISTKPKPGVVESISVVKPERNSTEDSCTLIINEQLTDLLVRHIQRMVNEAPGPTKLRYMIAGKLHHTNTGRFVNANSLQMLITQSGLKLALEDK